ncbi:MAG: twin-arginine translocase TatA/TatE family subunit [Thermoproteota archaeon]|nr:MAG: twin-arginine translocase TatA/TatE family subunit [Candidatus Korarchaeota archaeon]
MITSWETIIIAIIILALIIWGPQKLPEFARAIGQARREFEKASREEPKKEDLDEQIIKLAKELGISTEGKTKEQILQEIAEKAKK